MIVADVARGDGKDNSTFHVIELESMVQVAEYQGKIGTTEFANLLVEYATKYNDALLVIENASIGWSVIQVVIDRNYKNLFYSDSSTTYIDKKVETKYIRTNSNNTKSTPGFTTSLKTRPLIISKMEQYFTERTITIKSIRTINELTTFVWRNGRPEASPNYNDDLVIALAIGLWVRDTALRLFEKSKDLTKISLDTFKVERSGINAINQYTYLQNSRYMKIGMGNYDLRELI